MPAAFLPLYPVGHRKIQVNTYMRSYNITKSLNAVSGKNVEESEERQETVTPVYINSEYTNLKSIHNKGKEYR